MTTTGDIETTGDGAVRDARTRAERYEPAAIEPRWQQRWADLRLYDTDLDDHSRPRFFLLTMYPYPSGALHIGHWYIKTPTDAIARYKRMHGYNVFLPDRLRRVRAAGRERRDQERDQPARLDHGQHREDARPAADDGRDVRVGRRGRDLRPGVLPAGTSGCSSSSWRRAWPTARSRPWTGAPTTARWPASRSRARTAAAGAAARRSRSASCPSGTSASPSTRTTCWTSPGIDWPEPVKLMQTNWIGRSSGAEIVFETAPSAHHAGGEELRVFTTRPDTLFGATFMVLAPEHELVATLTAPDRRAEVDAYVAQAAAQDGDRPPVDGPREDRRRHRRGRDQPRQRRPDPDLHRGLRAGHLRHRRDHGRPRPRRARLRLRPGVRPADRQGRDAQGRGPRPGADRGVHGAHRRRGHGQLRPVHRPARRPRPGTTSSSGWASGARASRRSPTGCATG